MEKVYSFYWDCSRMGSLDGIFVADEEEVKNAIGANLYFGEVLGKHSEIYGTLEEKDITVLSDDPKDVEVIKRLIPDGTGFNPLDYLPEDEDAATDLARDMEEE